MLPTDWRRHVLTRSLFFFSVKFSPGALAEWLADHPVMLGNVLPLVLHALGNPDLSISSVSTLKKICRECKSDLPPYANNIVAVSQVMLTHSGFFGMCYCFYSLSNTCDYQLQSLSIIWFTSYNIGSCNFGVFYTNRTIKLTRSFLPLRRCSSSRSTRSVRVLAFSLFAFPAEFK